MQSVIYREKKVHVPFFIVYILSITLFSISLMELAHWVYHKMENHPDYKTEVNQESRKDVLIDKNEVNKELLKLRIEYSETDLFKPVPILKESSVYQGDITYKIADNQVPVKGYR